MTRDGRSLSALFRSLYDVGDDVDFSEFVSHHRIVDDEALATAIVTDGRTRMAIGRSVALQRYLEAAPDLWERPIPLDAAIEVTLRARADTGRSDDSMTSTGRP